jgi:hypothetical protein
MPFWSNNYRDFICFFAKNLIHFRKKIVGLLPALAFRLFKKTLTEIVL